MRFRIDLLECHRFAAIAVEYPAWRLVVHMDNLSFRNIGDLTTLFLCPICPGQILQAG